MPNDNYNRRLRHVMDTKNITYRELAEETGAHVKTVQRWVYEGRVPRELRAYQVAGILEAPVSWLWPTLAVAKSPAMVDVFEVYPAARNISVYVFMELLVLARRNLFICSGNEWFLEKLREVPRGPFGDLPKKISFRILVSPETEIYGKTAFGMPHLADSRMHVALEDVSIVRSDHLMLVVAGSVGLHISDSPAILYYRRADGGPFDVYARGLENLWVESADPEVSLYK